MEFRRAEDQRKRKPLASALALWCLLAPGAVLAQATMKSVQGKVLGPREMPISGAIVYLDDSKSNSIRSFISTRKGSYRFGQLSPNVDYKIWAKYKGVKSDTRAISSFSSRTNVYIDFHFKSK